METGYGARRAEDAQHTSWRGRRGTVWLYAGTEDVADDGEHGYRRAERTYAPWQGRRDTIWLCAGTEDAAEDREDVYRSVLLSIYYAFRNIRSALVRERLAYVRETEKTLLFVAPYFRPSLSASLYTARARARRVQLRRITCRYRLKIK